VNRPWYSRIPRWTLEIISTIEDDEILIIPTSIYLHTKLHAMIETSVTGAGVDMTKLPAALKGNATYPASEFTGVNRAEESVSEYVETLITWKQVPLADAQAILGLLLCNETGYVINLAFKSKAETLGVAKDILDLIAWDGKTYQNSAQGKMPQGFWAWLGTQIAGFFLAIVSFFIWLGSLIIAFGLWLIGLFASAAMVAIEATVKAIILVFVFIICIETPQKLPQRIN